MRIIHYCENPGGFMYDWHKFHMIDELRHHGHEIFYFNPIEHLGKKGTASEYAEVLIRYINSQKIKCDLFFATATDDTLDKNAISEIKRIGIPTINLSCDDLFLPFKIRKISSEFDLTWTTVKQNVNILKSYGAKICLQPWAANPYVYKPVDTNESSSICFIGTPYGARSKHLKSLTNEGFDVRVYGKIKSKEDVGEDQKSMIYRTVSNLMPNISTTIELLRFGSGRMALHGSVKRLLSEIFIKEDYSFTENLKFLPGPSFEDFSKIICENAISLGSIELASTYKLKKPLLFIRLREFEVPMSGGIHIVNQCDELMEYFEPDKEMIFYNSKEELIDKTKFYLDEKRIELRKKIRINARRRSEGEHTWNHRFTKIFKHFNLK